MGIQVEKLNGEQIVKLTKDIRGEGMKEILDEKHACMRVISMQEKPRVIFDRSINQEYLNQEKKEVVDELNDFLVNRCERIAILFNSEKEKVKYNYESHRKRRLINTKGFTNNEIERAKNFLNH